MITSEGNWWNYKNEFKIYKKEAGKTGFTKKEAEIIAPQVESLACLSKQVGDYQYAPVSLHKESFYVFINCTGKVSLPEKEGNPIKTLDKDLFLDFKTKKDLNV